MLDNAAPPPPASWQDCSHLWNSVNAAAGNSVNVDRHILPALMWNAQASAARAVASLGGDPAVIGEQVLIDRDRTDEEAAQPQQD